MTDLTAVISREEAAKDVRPQYTPGLTRFGRGHLARRHAKRDLRSTLAHSATLAALPHAVDFLAEANRQLGKPYRITGCRCSDTCPSQDCSGLVCGARNAVAAAFGYPPICMSSFGFGPMCRDAGRLISEAEAIWTPGAIGIENAFGTSNGANGTNGHVVIFEGDGLTTVEEMGTAYGCCHGQATGRGFNAWAKLPGFQYGFLLRGDGEMILQTKADGSLKPSPIDGRHAGHFVSQDGTYVSGANGGSISGDSTAEGDGHLMRRWYPMPVGPGQSLSIARRVNFTGLIATRSDGHEVVGDYS